jgi:hypothetical protein
MRRWGFAPFCAACPARHAVVASLARTLGLMKSYLSNLSAALLVALSVAQLGCSSGGERQWSSINGQVKPASGKNEFKSRAFWRENTRNALRSSSTDLFSRNFTLDLIAEATAQGSSTLAPCKSLDLTKVESLSLTAFEEPVPGKPPRVVKPSEYHEMWTVNACGSNQRWRIFDEGRYVRALLT